MNLLKKIGGKTFVYVVMLFTVIVSIFPIIWVVFSSFKTNAEILGNPFSFPTSLSFEPYVYLFEQYDFLLYAFNSFSVSMVATLISLLFYSMGAYVIAKYNFWGKNLFYILFTLTMLVPGHTKAQPIFTLILEMNLYDTREGLMLVYLSGGMAMSMFVLKAAFMSVPMELNESASLEGASFFTKFWTINVPLVKGALSTAGILMFLGNWNEYFYASLLTSSASNRTLPLALQFFNEAFSYDYTKFFAALTVVVLPGIIIYAVAQEQVQESIAATGMKG